MDKKCLNIRRSTYKRFMLFKISNDFMSVDLTINALLDYKDELDKVKNGK